MEKEKIILIGGGGHCKSCIDVIEKEDKYTISGILEKTDKPNEDILGYPILGTDDMIEGLAAEGYLFLITVGQIKSPLIREKIFQRVKSANGKLPVIISPFASVSRHAQIAEGTIVMHHVLVNADAKVGSCCILNSGCLIEHDSTIGDFCHISTSAVVNGTVTIGNKCFIGSKSLINNNLTICDSVIVPSGSKTTLNITKPGIFVKRR